ncbi:hypothetical protein NBRC116494_07630 [Aurantivibrio plasticivorans]
MMSHSSFNLHRGLACCLVACVAFSANSFAESIKSLIGKDNVYLLVNQHPDEGRQRMYTVNYQLPAVLPVCTKVRLTKLKRKYLEFEVPERGDREYRYYLHKSLPGDFQDHLAEIFGTNCPDISKMSKKDQEGIKAGRPLVGMTKKGVLIAMGPPPAHVTYSTDLDTWVYWVNRFNKQNVEFKDGKVSKVID